MRVLPVDLGRSDDDEISAFPPYTLAWRTAIAVPLAALLLVLLVAACGGTDATPEVVIVTATHTPEPVVIVITATFTPTPDTGEPDTAPSPTPSPTPTPTRQRNPLNRWSRRGPIRRLRYVHDQGDLAPATDRNTGTAGASGDADPQTDLSPQGFACILPRGL